jgi:hypothetical protein
MRTLLAGVLTFVLALAAAGVALGGYVRRHFPPTQAMEAAVAAGDGCVVVFGDSRTEAAFDAKALRRGLGREDRCVVGLALGGTEIAGHFFTAREYLERGRKPALVVLGMVGDSLLGPETAPRPEDLVGNNVIHFQWSRAGDVADDVPGFPLRDIGAFDAGFRWLADRATPFGRYASLVAVRTQAFTHRLTGRADTQRNRFGPLFEMTALEGGLRARAPERLAAALRGPEAERLGRWFPRIERIVSWRGASLLVVELPMRRLYRDKVTDLPDAVAYRAWIAAHVPGWLDLSHAPFVDDALFADALHLGPAGAELVSEEMGRRAAAMLQAPSVAPQIFAP